MEEPQAQTPVEETQQPNETPNAAPEQVTPEVPAETEAPAPEAPAAPVPQAQEAVTPAEDDDDLYGFNQTPQEPAKPIGGIDVNSLPKDEYGNVDANAFVQALAAQQQQVLQTATEQARREVLETLQEQKLWEKAMKTYPELKENKELRDLVHKQRAGAIIAGQNATPLQAASTLFKHIKTAQDQGKKEATESTRVQASAHLETSDVRTDAAADNSKDLWRNIDSPNRLEAKAAREAVLGDMIKKGSIKIPGFNA